MGCVHSLFSKPGNQMYKIMLFEGLLVEVPILSDTNDNETTSPRSTPPDTERFLSDDSKGTLSSKIFEKKRILNFLSSFSKKDEVTLNILIEKYSEIDLNNLSESYIKELETEETYKLANVCKHLEDANKELLECLHSKQTEMEERILNLKSHINKNSPFFEEFSEISQVFCGISKQSIISYYESVTKLKVLHSLESRVKKLEYVFISLSSDNFLKRKFEEIEKELRELVKNSLKSLKTIESNLTDKQNSRHNSLSLISNDLNLDNYLTFSESLISCLQMLNSLENSKEHLFTISPLNESILQLGEIFSKNFINSEKSKEKAFTNLNKLFKQEIDQRLFVHEELNHSEIKKTGSLSILQDLLSKNQKISEISKEQDLIFENFWKKITSFEALLDEVDLKLLESVDADVKELSKIVGLSDLEAKEKIEKIKEDIGRIKEVELIDMTSHLESILRVFESSNDLLSIKSAVREAQTKELIKTRQEMNEKFGVFLLAKSALETEKKSLEQSNVMLKSNMEKASSLAEKMSQAVSDKELEISDCRNTLASTKEELSQALEKVTQQEEEMDLLTKELRTLKRTLRDKENEINELKGAE